MKEGGNMKGLKERYPHSVRDIEALAKEKPVVTEERLHELCEGNTLLGDLVVSAIKYSCLYTEDVLQMQEFIATGKVGDAEFAQELAEMDSARTRLHNATIDAYNILSRGLARFEKDNSWRAELTDRVSIGLLAIQLGVQHFINLELEGENHE
jgi:hypothetical protein